MGEQRHFTNFSGYELIDWETVEEITTISRRTVDRLEKAGRFPSRIRIGYRTVRWVRQEVEEWRTSLIAAHKGGGHG